MDSTTKLGFGILALSCILIEAWLTQRRGRPVYEVHETLATIGVFLGGRVFKLLSIPFILGLVEILRPWSLFDLPSTPLVFGLAVVVTDFVYYWNHRLSHEIRLLWAVHLTHHTAERMNLLTAVRLNWLGPFVMSPLIITPVVLLGVPSSLVGAVLALDLGFQLFLHTELVPRLPLLEGWLNTPAAHRVHHARNPSCLDVNYGGIFMIWDRLFGTWRAPDLPVESLDYGLTTGPAGHNPLWLVFGGLVQWWRGEARPRSS